MTAPLHHITHPLVKHKLTLMRQKDCSTHSFRRLMGEISMLMAYEVTRDMPTQLIDIETPLEAMKSPTIYRELNDHGHFLPGLGDAGDRLFGTK